jgi:tRNA (cmo5U34)-methyltransferase
VSDQRDTLYADTVTEPGLFAFDDRVARVFPDMIKRSVPGYTTVVAMTGLIAARYAKTDTLLFDLGCSLGASTLSVRQHTLPPGSRIVGVDNSEAMLAQCRTIIDTDSHDTPVDLVCADLAQVKVENASVVVLNWTLQFVPLEMRGAVVAGIYDGLHPGGVLVLSEKVTFEDPHLDALNIDLHHEFKRANGYSDLEIANKRSALENVLVPETLATHKSRLGEAGFETCDVWFQCFNFASLVAIK